MLALRDRENSCHILVLRSWTILEFLPPCAGCVPSDPGVLWHMRRCQCQPPPASVVSTRHRQRSLISCFPASLAWPPGLSPRALLRRKVSLTSEIPLVSLLNVKQPAWECLLIALKCCHIIPCSHTRIKGRICPSDRCPWLWCACAPFYPDVVASSGRCRDTASADVSPWSRCVSRGPECGQETPSVIIRR